MAQVICQLPSKCKALSSDHSTVLKKKKAQGGKLMVGVAGPECWKVPPRKPWQGLECGQCYFGRFSLAAPWKAWGKAAQGGGAWKAVRAQRVTVLCRALHRASLWSPEGAVRQQAVEVSAGGSGALRRCAQLCMQAVSVNMSPHMHVHTCAPHSHS
jgi:hypothetical protein